MAVFINCKMYYMRMIAFYTHTPTGLNTDSQFYTLTL